MTENKRSRCDGDDAKMSLVVRKNEKVCAVFIQKASLEQNDPYLNADTKYFPMLIG